MRRFVGLFVLLAMLMIVRNGLCAPPGRIVSLAPSITEILFDLGLGCRIVGVTDYCDYPAEAKSKPKIGGFANPSLEAIVAARPDWVILTEDGNPQEVHLRLKKLGIKTHVFRAKRLKDLPQGIRDLGSALGIETVAASRASRVEEQLAGLAKKAQASLSGRATPRALFVIYPEPLLVAGKGTVVDDALNLLGLENIAASGGRPYVKYTIEEIVRRSPDVVFIGQGPMSRNLSQSLLQRLEKLDAVRKGHVYYTSELLYRLTPRAILGIEEIADHLQGL